MERLSPGVLVRSLRFKLTVWNTLVVLLVAVLALVSVRQGLYFMLMGETDAVLQNEAEEILLAVQQSYPDRQAIYKELQRKSAVHEQHGWFVQLLERPGNSFWASPAAPPQVLSRSVATPMRNPVTIGPYRVVQQELRQPGLPRFVVRVGTSTEFIEQDVAQVTRIAAPVAAVILLLAPIGGFILSGRATQPLQKIIATTENLRPSRMSDRLPIRGTGDELDQLSQKINVFLDQIAQYLQQNREFVANAAHELRSPLTAIQSSVEIALGKERSVAEYEELLSSITEEIQRLTTLINQLLMLAESDAGRLELIAQPVRLADIVQRSLDMFEGVAEDRQVSLSAAIEPEVIVAGDAGQLRQVVNNLLDNAIRFTPAGGRVELRLQADHQPREAVLTVCDTGIGIPPEDLPHIFERFYQVDRARQRQSSDRGGGLGLSICESVVANHRGRIDVVSQLDSGTTFTVHLPLMTSDF